MSRSSSAQVIHTSSSFGGSKGKTSAKVKLAAGYLQCSVCRIPRRRESLDALLRCEPCEEDMCIRCRRPLQDDGTCIVCLEVEVATDVEVAVRQAEGSADVLGNPARRPGLMEDDEYNAYSAGVCEYDVTDSEIDTIRERDSDNEWRREMRATVNVNGHCPVCSLELSVAERTRGAHTDCVE